MIDHQFPQIMFVFWSNSSKKTICKIMLWRGCWERNNINVNFSETHLELVCTCHQVCDGGNLAQNRCPGRMNLLTKLIFPVKDCTWHACFLFTQVTSSWIVSCYQSGVLSNAMATIWNHMLGKFMCCEVGCCMGTLRCPIQAGATQESKYHHVQC